jgi:hypothetical protein
MAEALAVLLWNKTYYQYRKFDDARFMGILIFLPPVLQTSDGPASNYSRLFCPVVGQLLPVPGHHRRSLYGRRKGDSAGSKDATGQHVDVADVLFDRHRVRYDHAEAGPRRYPLPSSGVR